MTKWAPKKPAQPVTRIIWEWAGGERSSPTRCEGPDLTIRTALARGLDAVVSAVPVDEPRQAFGQRRRGRETGGRTEAFDRRVGGGDVAGLHRQHLATRGSPEQALERRDELVELDRLVVADVVERVRHVRRR